MNVKKNNKNSLHIDNLNLFPTKMLLKSSEKDRGKTKRKSNSIIGSNIEENSFQHNLKNFTNEQKKNDMINHDNKCHLKKGLNDIYNMAKSGNILTTEELHTNINIIVNNNFIKSINDSHSQTNFRSDLFSVNRQKTNSKNLKSFNIHGTPNKNVGHKIKDRNEEKKSKNPHQRELKSSQVSSTSLNKGFSILNNAKAKIQMLKTKTTNSHSNSNTNSTVNSNRKLNNFTNYIMNSKIYSNPLTREVSMNNLSKGVLNTRVNTVNIIVQPNVTTNIKEPKNNNKFINQIKAKNISSKKEDIFTVSSTMKTKNKIKSSSYIQNSYSKLARSLKENKSNTGRTSFPNPSNTGNIYFSNYSKPQIHKSNDVHEFSDYKIKSYEEKKKLLNNSQFSDLDDGSQNLKSSIRKNKNNNELDVYESSLNHSHSPNLSKNTEFFPEHIHKDSETKLLSNPNNSVNNSFHNNISKFNINNYTDNANILVPGNKHKGDKSVGNLKDNSLLSNKTTSLKNVEDIEQMHFTYVRLNQQKRLFVHNFENDEENWEISDDNLEYE